MDRITQKKKMLWLLQSAWPGWVPAVALARISLQYGSRIFELRRSGFLIQNRMRIVGGIRHGEFRLGPRPTPSNRELRGAARRSESNHPTLFGEIAPGRYPD